MWRFDLAGGYDVGMLRQILFALCCVVTVLATLFIGVGISQLWAVWDGTYDPIRDDHRPADFLPTYYANISRMMLASFIVAVIAAVFAMGFRPKKFLVR
jgi:hypothetical protein